jgi:hypothetical protein
MTGFRPSLACRMEEILGIKDRIQTENEDLQIWVWVMTCQDAIFALQTYLSCLFYCG